VIAYPNRPGFYPHSIAEPIDNNNGYNNEKPASTTISSTNTTTKDEPAFELEGEGKWDKVNDVVTVDKKHSNNDIQRPEEENKQQSTATTNTVF
jgi:hypothetical protein